MRKFIALTFSILALASCLALPISASSGSATTAPRIYFVKYYEGNDVAVLQEVVFFDTTTYDYSLTVAGDDLYLGNVTFTFNAPDETQSYTYISVNSMIGFSMVGYNSDLHTEPTYMLDYDVGVLLTLSQDLSNSGGSPYWICQLFVDEFYTGSDGLSGNIWDELLDTEVEDPDTSAPRVYFFKYYEGNDVFVYYDLLRFLTSTTDYTLTVVGDGSTAANVTFSWDAPDNSSSLSVSGLSNMIGFSMLSYYSSPHTEPSIIADYVADVMYSGNSDLSNVGSQRIWICQIFVNETYTGTDGVTDPWSYLFDNPSNPDYKPPYSWDEIESKYQDIEDKINDYNSNIALDTSSAEDVGDFVLNFGGNHDIFNYYEPTVLAPVSYVMNSPYVLLFLIIAFTFALVSYILFGKRG